MKSRKLWMAIVAAVIVVLNDGLGLGLPTDAIMTVAAIAISYILGQGAVDIAMIKSNNIP